MAKKELQKCPNEDCGSNDVEYQQGDHFEEGVEEKYSELMKCNVCGSTWREEYVYARTTKVQIEERDLKLSELNIEDLDHALEGLSIAIDHIDAESNLIPPLKMLRECVKTKIRAMTPRL